MRLSWLALLLVGLRAVALGWSQVRDLRASRGTPQGVVAGLERLGGESLVSFGTCLSGLPGLRKPAEVYAGFRPGEVLFLDRKGTEVGRVPLAALRAILGGDWDEVGPYLEARREPQGLLGSVIRFFGKEPPPGYLLLEWRSDFGETRRAVFRYLERKLAEGREQIIQLHREDAESG